MNTATIATNAQKAGATRSRRAKAGKYPTTAQRMAFTVLMQLGASELTQEDMQALAGHPYLTASQREKFGALAAK